MDLHYADMIIVRFGELSIKGHNRRYFVRQLQNNIKAKLKAYPLIRIYSKFDHLVIQLNGTPDEPVTTALSYVFGIASFSLAHKCSNQIQDIIDTAVDLMRTEEPCTFKVETHRKDKHLPYDSMELNATVGHHIIENTTHKVDIKTPQKKVRIEVDSQQAYVSVKIFKGLQGFPVGVQSKAMVLISGGIDSPVASYLTLKRGVEIEAVHFAAPPYTSAQALEKVKSLLSVLCAYQPNIKLHVIPFTQIQLEIYQKANPAYAITLMRRQMVRLAQELAEKRKALALVTGESLGQVASQTMESMGVISEVSHMNILRPLVTYDKLEIIEIAERIKTFPISILPYEDCCTIFSVTNPITKPRLPDVLREEAKCDFSIVYPQALSEVQTIIITEQASESYL
jgi:thiamine biosynthesis protein ThiI